MGYWNARVSRLFKGASSIGEDYDRREVSFRVASLSCTRDALASVLSEFGQDVGITLSAAETGWGELVVVVCLTNVAFPAGPA